MSPGTNEMIDRFIQAKLSGLSGWELLRDIDAVERECNGIGAACFSARIRDGLNLRHPALVTPSWIHDRRYSIGGTENARKCADLEFLRNCVRMTVQIYPWYHVCRYREIFTALRFYICLLEGGRIAYHYDQL